MKKSIESIASHSNNLEDYKVLRLKDIKPDWIGQTIASICWIISVFAYGIESKGDLFQLAAAFSWLLSNIISLRN